MKNIDEMPAETARLVQAVLGEYGINLEDIKAQQERKKEDWKPAKVVSEKFSISRTYLWKMAKEGKIQYSKLNKGKGGRILYNISSIEKYIETKINQSFNTIK